MMKEGSASPWGPIQTVTKLADGIVSVTTASHGGICVSPSLLAKMPVKSTPYSEGGWFEEDCDWALVALCFPYAFTPGSVEYAKKLAKGSYLAGVLAANDAQIAVANG